MCVCMYLFGGVGLTKSPCFVLNLLPSLSVVSLKRSCRFCLHFRDIASLFEPLFSEVTPLVTSLKFWMCLFSPAICDIGKASFKYDMRRLSEILSLPKAWYRRNLARRLFLGDDSMTRAGGEGSLSWLWFGLWLWLGVLLLCFYTLIYLSV